MAHLLRLILTALILALAVPVPGAQAAGETAFSLIETHEAAAPADPPEGLPPVAHPKGRPRAHGPRRLKTPTPSRRTPAPQRPQARAPPHP